MRRLGLAVTLSALAVSGCSFGLTAVQNNSASDLVVEAVEDDGYVREVRYYPVPAGALIGVDSTGEVNGPPESIVFFDRDCNRLSEERRAFSIDGGVLTYGPDHRATYKPGLESSGQDPERKGLFDTCAQAANALP